MEPNGFLVIDRRETRSRRCGDRIAISHFDFRSGRRGKRAGRTATGIEENHTIGTDFQRLLGDVIEQIPKNFLGVTLVFDQSENSIAERRRSIFPHVHAIDNLPSSAGPLLNGVSLPRRVFRGCTTGENENGEKSEKRAELHGKWLRDQIVETTGGGLNREISSPAERRKLVEKIPVIHVLNGGLTMKISLIYWIGILGVVLSMGVGCHSIPNAEKEANNFRGRFRRRVRFLPRSRRRHPDQKRSAWTWIPLALQAKSTPAKIARAQWTFALTVFTFSEALGPKFTQAHFSKTAVFFGQLNDLVKSINDDLESNFKRPHPFEVDPRIKRFGIAPSGYSYPSYHYARCEVFWRTLELLDPPRAAEFHKVAEGVEQDRGFAGEHFPTDIEAGSELGRLIWAALEKDENFRAGVARMKADEWTPAP